MYLDDEKAFTVNLSVREIATLMASLGLWAHNLENGIEPGAEFSILASEEGRVAPLDEVETINLFEELLTAIEMKS